MISAIVQDIAARHHLVRKGDKYVGKCPRCGGSERTDRFNIRLDGGYKCYSCGECQGDIITWLREMEGKSCPDAHEEAGMDCRLGASCQAYGTCRFGDGSGRRTARRPRAATVPPPARTPELATARPGAPDQRWSAWADKMIASAAKALHGKKDIRTWLRNRGIDDAAAQRFRLGWIARDSKIDRAALGLAPMKNGKPTLWIPSGLVIPIFDADGNIHRIRVRRPGWSRAKFLEDLKYVWIEGSGLETMAIQPSGTLRGAVVVEAELDGEACAAAHPDVLVIALGTVQGGLTDALRQQLQDVPVILVALDADGPGAAAVSTWLREYRQAKYWPVPAGKDPGDYVRDGGDLLVWIEAGLPPAVAPRHEAAASPDGTSSGGMGCAVDTYSPCSLERDPEVLELIDLLRRHSGYLLIDWHGRELGVWYPQQLTPENRPERLRVNDLLYRGDKVPRLVGLMSAGRWDAAQVARFVGIKGQSEECHANND